MTKNRKTGACAVAVPGATYRSSCVYRTGFRNDAGDRYHVIGFRLAQDIP
jgi:hypothetical protein